MSGVFFAYSRADHEVVTRLVVDLATHGVDVWLDQDLVGGELWWEAILRNIRNASAVVFALSNHAWRSEPCRLEVDYAQRLGIPVRYIRVGPFEGSRRFAGLGGLLDYADGEVASLARELTRCTASPVRPPDPLPEPPKLPSAYSVRPGEPAPPDLPDPAAWSRGGVFVSYRREGAGHIAGRIADRLAGRFGEGQVFIDVESIELGLDFRQVIAEAIDRCEVLLAIIGPGWSTARLSEPGDLVRVEIETALRRGIRVIPVLVDDAEMPRTKDLPASLAGLTHRHATTIRHVTFRQDVTRLVDVLGRILPNRVQD
ncbi:MAG: toll/interleukin-1 receptor domain-containing protein [Actinophytocola sp.]|uniref:toll/interleukin-1 receptor domain-containing protein n=1 Tax=Actinophytocola sp. TaxID=1872138 RepID=UPI003D6C3EF6